MYSEIISFIRKVHQNPSDFVPLHAPYFGGNEKKYVIDTIDSTFVSSVGAYVTQFEKMMTEITGAKYAVATANGTTALHLALVVAGVVVGDEVITQPITFVSTVNAIAHCGADAVFVDVDRDTMGMSPESLSSFLAENTIRKDNVTINKKTGKRIAACVPMHTFGLPLRIDRIAEICSEYNIALIEDAAESIGSYYKGKHTGTFGLMGTFSFNGNKTVTCGGGGAIVTNDESIAKHAKHLSVIAKLPHAWEFVHDEIGYNYSMPNLNAALACAQLEQLNTIVENKRELAHLYHGFLTEQGIGFAKEIEGASSNYWLNTMILENAEQRDKLLQVTNEQKVMTRPIWRLMNKLEMYQHCQKTDLQHSEWLEQRVINIPSSFRAHAKSMTHSKLQASVSNS